MARRRNPKTFYAARDCRIWELASAPKYINARTIGEDAKVNLSERQVQRRLKAITDNFKARHHLLVDAEKYRQLAQHRVIAEEAWEAWLESRRQVKRVKMKRENHVLSPADAGHENGPMPTDETESGIIVDQCGDPRFLVVYMKAMKEIREIIGADEPIEVDDRLNNISEMLARTYEDERMRIIPKNGPVQRLPWSDKEKVQ